MDGAGSDLGGGLEFTQKAWNFLTSRAATLGVPLLKIQTLTEFVSEVELMTRMQDDENAIDDLHTIVDQASVLFEHYYAHRPYKEDLYGVKPGEQLAQLRESASTMSTVEFHTRMLEVFDSVRDAHTGYILPAPFDTAAAILPFQMRRIQDAAGKCSYLVTRILETEAGKGFGESPFRIGVEVTKWNGQPVEDAILQANEVGGNSAAAMARGALRVTLRPLGFAKMPKVEDEIVTITFVAPGATAEQQIQLRWGVMTGLPAEKGVPQNAFSMNPAQCAVGYVDKYLFNQDKLREERLAGWAGAKTGEWTAQAITAAADGLKGAVAAASGTVPAPTVQAADALVTKTAADARAAATGTVDAAVRGWATAAIGAAHNSPISAETAAGLWSSVSGLAKGTPVLVPVVATLNSLAGEAAAAASAGSAPGGVVQASTGQASTSQASPVPATDSAQFDDTVISRHPEQFRFQYTGGTERPLFVRPQDLTDPDHPEKKFGYVQILQFAARGFEPSDDLDVNADEFRRILEFLNGVAPDGLILDIRGNGGGDIRTAERELQMLIPELLEPARFHLASTPAVDAMVMAADDLSVPGKFKDAGLAPGDNRITGGKVLTNTAPVLDKGQAYMGPVVLVIDGTTYSAADIFSGGFADHNIGTIIGTDAATGGGGASVWTHAELISNAGNSTDRLMPLPSGIGMRLAALRSSRVNKPVLTFIEDVGVSVDEPVYLPTAADVTGTFGGLFSHICRNILSKKTRPRVDVLSATPGPDSVVVEVRIKGAEKVSFQLNTQAVRRSDGKVSFVEGQEQVAAVDKQDTVSQILPFSGTPQDGIELVVKGLAAGADGTDTVVARLWRQIRQAKTRRE